MASSSNSSNPESLAVLSETVNQTLIEIGRFFRSFGSLKSRAQLKRSIPVTHEQFQCALDNLSEEIFMAKAFLERDYEAVLAAKAPPEAPVQDATMREAGEEEKNTEKEIPQSAENNNNIKTEKDDAEGTELKTAPPDGPTEEPTTTVEVNQPNDIPGDNVAGDVEKKSKTEKDAAQPENEGADIDFDSILNSNRSAEPTGNEFEFHLGFENDDVGNHNSLFNRGFENLETDSDNNNIVKTEPQDAGPGVVQEGQQGQQAEQQQGQQQEEQQQGQQQEEQQQGQGQQEGQQPDTKNNSNMEETMALGESSFDDLFMDSDNFGGGGAGDQGLLEGDRLMNMSELDDSWFT